MPIGPFLAMTAGEMREKSVFPQKIAWMACHFSPYCTGLSNLPRELPPGSLLILDDITPIHGHDPAFIAAQLKEWVEAFACYGVLLDFQRPENDEAAALVNALAEALPCPVGVSDLYAGDVNCPVFLPPVPPSVPLEEHLLPWNGREVWLEMALNGEVISLTEKGPVVMPLPNEEAPTDGLWDEQLHCHYTMQLLVDEAKFTLWRTQEDLEALLKGAEELGVTTAVGLYQELHGFAMPKPFPVGRL